MKSQLLIPILGLYFALHAGAQSHSTLRMETMIDGKATYSEKSSKEKTQARKLTIEVSNTAEKPVAGTIVRWAIYGHNLKGNNLVVIKQGKQDITVPARGKTSVNSPEVKITGNREQTVTVRAPANHNGNSRNRNRNRTIQKKIPAAGQDYYGYGVEVVTDGKIVASEYSKPSIEEDMGGGR